MEPIAVTTSTIASSTVAAEGARRIATEAARHAATEVVRETTREATAQTIREAAQEALETTIRETSRLSNIEHTQDFSRRFKDLVLSDDFLRTKKERLGKSPELQTAVLNELRNDPNFVGRLAEVYAEARFADLGTVQTQVVVGNNRIDMFVDLSQNVKFTEIDVVDGQVITRSFYEQPGTSIAMEVKNGSMETLLRDGRLVDQVRAGMEIADRSHLVVRQDLLASLRAEPGKAHTLLSRIHAGRGKMVIGLPDYQTQLAHFIGL